jgi:hypothetical protein
MQSQQNFMELAGHPSEIPQHSSTSLTEQRSFGPIKDTRNEMLMHFMDAAAAHSATQDLN